MTCRCACHVSGPYRPACDVPGGCGHLHTDTPPEDYRCPCLLCPSTCEGHAHDDRRVHDGCRKRLRRDLAEIPEMYALLGEEHGGGGGAGPKVSGSREAPIPGRLDVLNLRGPAARGRVSDTLGDQHGQVPVFAALESWERDWRQSRGLAISGVWPDLETALTGIVDFLYRHLDWACDEHPAIDEFATEVRQVRRSISAARGDRPDTVAVGDCPTVLEGGAVCGARLYASTWRDWITCPKCGARRERAGWKNLGTIMRTGGAA